MARNAPRSRLESGPRGVADVRAPEPGADSARRGASAATVLRCVLDHGPIARSAIARATGLSPASVTGHSAELARLGLIRDRPDAARVSGVGRPHIPVDLDTCGYVVGAVHIAVPHITAALVDLRGRVLARHQAPHNGVDPSRVVGRACDALATLLAQRERPLAPLGVGVAIGGRVDSATGTVLEHPMLGWRDVPLRDMFAACTGLLVRADGHARALLAAERLFGVARGRASVMQLVVGNVVDAAFATGETIQHGPGFGAGTIAHVPVEGHDGLCPCGRAGCLQQAVGERAVAARAHADGVIPEPDFALLLDAALAGSPAARAVFTERARLLGRATALLIDVFDPELVVAVEPGVMLLPQALAALHAEVRGRIAAPRDVACSVVAGGFGWNTAAIAGGAVVLDVLYRDPLALLATARRVGNAA